MKSENRKEQKTAGLRDMWKEETWLNKNEMGSTRKSCKKAGQEGQDGWLRSQDRVPVRVQTSQRHCKGQPPTSRAFR